MSNAQAQVCLTRIESFCAAHRLHSKELSDDENKKVFGKCNHIHGHGHNYILEVTIRGPVDKTTGIIMNLVELKEIIHDVVLSKVDHKHLNFDVDEFKTLNPTAENIAYVFWQWLDNALPNQLLYEIKLHETAKNIAYIRRQD